MNSERRFPIKADSAAKAYLLPSDRFKGSIPWQDAIPVIQRWHRSNYILKETFEDGMERLAAEGGLDHTTMGHLSSQHWDNRAVKMLDAIDWRGSFLPDVASELFDDVEPNKVFVHSLSEALLFSTVLIQTRSKDKTGSATGILFKVKQRRFIVTNKHVFVDANLALFYFSISAEQTLTSGDSFDFKLTNFDHLINHPELDLCALSFDLVESESKADNTDLCVTFLDSTFVPTVDTLNLLPLTQEVFMYGYPIGLWDSVNHLPVVRRGSLASHPALNYDGKPFGAVDIAAFPGSSGSPVFVLNDGGPISDKLGRVSNRRVAQFLGLLTKGARINFDGSVDVVAIPVQHQDVSRQDMTLIHLGFYIKACEIAKFVSQIELAK